MPGLQGHPEALEMRGLPLLVMFLPAGPPLRNLAGRFEVKDMPPLDLIPVRADVVLGHPELPHNREPAEPGLLLRFPQRRLLRRLTWPHGPSRNLNADFLPGVVGMPEDQQPAIAYDVTEHLVRDHLLGHDDLPCRADHRSHSPPN